MSAQAMCDDNVETGVVQCNVCELYQQTGKNVWEFRFYVYLFFECMHVFYVSHMAYTAQGILYK